MLRCALLLCCAVSAAKHAWQDWFQHSMAESQRHMHSLLRCIHVVLCNHATERALSMQQVCSVTCCGIINFEQHCTSKKHLRKAAAVARATVSSSSLFLPGAEATPTASQSSDAANGTTYVGVKAQCRTYCKQVATRFPLLSSCAFTCFHCWLTTLSTNSEPQAVRQRFAIACLPIALPL